MHILPDIWDDGKNRLPIINLFKYRDNSYRYLECRQKTNSDVWIHHLASWHASFTDFFVKLRRYTDIGKQLFISNDRYRVRWEVLGLSQDGVCTYSFENFSVKCLKRDQSNETKFNPPWSIPLTQQIFYNRSIWTRDEKLNRRGNNAGNSYLE